jgi:hypothetical protein
LGHPNQDGVVFPFLTKGSIMGILFDMAAFYRWLEEASDEEIIAKRDEALALRKSLEDERLIADVTYLVREMERALVARNLQF